MLIQLPKLIPTRTVVMSESYLTTRQVAELLDITDRHVRRLVADGKLKAVRIGGTGRPRYQAKEVERMLKPDLHGGISEVDLEEHIKNHA
jgi:excisionase family DNA binding protein